MKMAITTAAVTARQRRSRRWRPQPSVSPPARAAACLELLRVRMGLWPAAKTTTTATMAAGEDEIRDARRRR